MLTFVVSHVKIFLTSSLIAMQNLAAFSHTVCVCTSSQNIEGRWGPTPLGWGVADHLKHATGPHVLPHQILSL